jgi:hypothetical protein
MSRSKGLLALGLAACVGATLALAEDTITVVGSDGTPDQILNEIALPDSASDNAREHARFGQTVANQAHDQASTMGHDFGQQVSSDARDLGAQLRQDVQADHAGAGGHGRP